MILAGLALICFMLGMMGAQPAAAARPINWESAGLALLTIVYLITRA